jgi:voltage-gated potassium channel
MADGATGDDGLQGTGYELFIAALAILSVVNLALLAAIANEDLDRVLYAMNVLLSLIFLADFAYRFAKAPVKAEYLGPQFGWADLLAAIPVPQVKILRAFRLVRAYRMVRSAGGRGLVRSLLLDRAASALFTLLLLGVLVLEFGSLAILQLEQRASGSNIETASDAIWYVLVTISTVGYGDRFPVTNEGRLLGAAIIVVGVGIFGTFTGYLANLFLTPAPQRASVEDATADASSLDHARARLADLRERLAAQQSEVEEIERLLADERPSGAGGPA